MNHICRRLLRSLLFLPVLAAALPAQDVGAARAWLPDDYRNIAGVDLALLRDRGVWEELRASVLGGTFGAMEKELGFPFAALDKVVMVATLDDRGPKESREVRVLVGNQALPDVPRGADNYGQEKVGQHDVLVRDYYRREYFLHPQPELQVFGTASALDPVLKGEVKGGLPCPDVMSLLSRPAMTFAWFTVDLSVPTMRRRVLQSLFADSSWPEGDEPTFLCVRCNITGDADDPHLAVEATLRHAKDGDGIAATATAVDAVLTRFGEEPRLRLVKPLLGKVEKKHNRNDYVLSLDLGRARAAVGNLAALALPMFAPIRAETVAAPAATAPVPAPAPAPEQPK